MECYTVHTHLWKSMYFFAIKMKGRALIWVPDNSGLVFYQGNNKLWGIVLGNMFSVSENGQKIFKLFWPPNSFSLTGTSCSQETPTSEITDFKLTKYTFVLGWDSIILVNCLTCSVHVENRHVSVLSQIYDES